MTICWENLPFFMTEPMTNQACIAAARYDGWEDWVRGQYSKYACIAQARRGNDFALFARVRRGSSSALRTRLDGNATYASGPAHEAASLALVHHQQHPSGPSQARVRVFLVLRWGNDVARFKFGAILGV
eukprot:COSAG06_NODE_2551_length_6684_cov_3.568565_2_plen_129_part_00